MPLILPRTPLSIQPDQTALPGRVTLSFRLGSTQPTRATIRYFLTEPSVVLVRGGVRSFQEIDGPMNVPVVIQKVLNLDNQPPPPFFHGLLRINVEFQEVNAQGNPVGPSRKRSARLIIL